MQRTLEIGTTRHTINSTKKEKEKKREIRGIKGSNINSNQMGKKYQTIQTVAKSNRKVVETETKSIPLEPS